MTHPGDEFDEVEVTALGDREPRHVWVLKRDGRVQAIALAQLLYVLGRIDVAELERQVERALTASTTG